MAADPTVHPSSRRFGDSPILQKKKKIIIKIDIIWWIGSYALLFVELPKKKGGIMQYFYNSCHL